MPRANSNRMGKITRTGESEAFRAAGPLYPKKTTVDFSDDDYRALRRATVDDDIPMAARIRALVALWREDEKLAQSVTRRAGEILAETRTSGNRAGK